ncbi:hypothetical protein VCUG_01027 [Vavraia culicis subsp. floridensis]|uniref:Uncharacterized protein n=1 Tax=Vavraia culicis (isolate floridensis) TaxID=948595 RepID=L2GWN2_VAVCU|nr:uncharacterized protein VCUG_01027 [Vavraia culicis subsp. floridensis]ELA47495.1 hypothetical protein VCUG_01027 [Vavraia culicis subsp. floridensis]
MTPKQLQICLLLQLHLTNSREQSKGSITGSDCDRWPVIPVHVTKITTKEVAVLFLRSSTENCTNPCYLRIRRVITQPGAYNPFTCRSNIQNRPCCAVLQLGCSQPYTPRCRITDHHPKQIQNTPCT